MKNERRRDTFWYHDNFFVSGVTSACDPTRGRDIYNP